MHMNDWEWDEEDWFLPKSDVYPHAFNHYDWKYWWAVICESDLGYGTFPAKMDEDGFVEYYIGFYGSMQRKEAVKRCTLITSNRYTGINSYGSRGTQHGYISASSFSS